MLVLFPKFPKLQVFKNVFPSEPFVAPKSFDNFYKQRYFPCFLNTRTHEYERETVLSHTFRFIAHQYREISKSLNFFQLLKWQATCAPAKKNIHIFFHGINDPMKRK